jgi:multidrug transporter EmrE-like cation transporter
VLALYTAVYVGLSTSGLLLLRRSLSRAGGDYGSVVWNLLRNPEVLAGGALYVLSFLTFLLALRRFQLSLVYPVFVASGYIAVVLGAWVVLDEELSLSRGIGMALVAAGLVFVTR